MDSLTYILLFLLLISGCIIFIQRKKISGSQKDLSRSVKKYHELMAEHERIKKTLLRNSERDGFRNKLISMLAHDFRGAFMNLLSLMDFYQKGEIQEENFAALFEELKATSRNNLKAFESTLKWVKTQIDGYNYHPKPLSISSAIEEAFENNSSDFKRKEISLLVKGDKEAKILADPQLTRYLLHSLVNNAIKFSYQGGSIECEIKKVKNNNIQVQIIDYGVGMDEETLHSLFFHDKTLFTGTLGEKGAGIALLICKDFAEMQDGILEAVSGIGKGSVFTLTVPGA